MTTALATITSRAVITLGGAFIGGIDADGVQVEYDKIDGWHSAAPKRSGFTDRDNADGQFDAQVYKSGRVVTISGWCAAPSRALAGRAVHRVTGILPGGTLGTLTVDDPDYGTLSAQVRISDGPQIDWSEIERRFIWQFQVTAPDPLKYGPDVAVTTGLPASGGGLGFPLFSPNGVLDFGLSGVSGQVALTINGTAGTWPVFVIAGPVLGGFTLVDVTSGRLIQFADDVPAGATLVIRSDDGSALLNGADRSGDLVVGQWWQVPPADMDGNAGTSTVQWNAPASAGLAGMLTVITNDAHE